MKQHDWEAIEVIYPHHMGGNMMDGYMCNDKQMAQSAIDFACESATIIERERIIALLETNAENWSSDCQKPLDPQHCQSCWLFVDLIALIKGENNASE